MVGMTAALACEICVAAVARCCKPGDSAEESKVRCEGVTSVLDDLRLLTRVDAAGRSEAGLLVLIPYYKS
jgi:hypothetical protein